jgi:hypothetical protein
MQTIAATTIKSVSLLFLRSLFSSRGSGALSGPDSTINWALQQLAFTGQ